eukprot:tig00021795_g23543.t1
MERRAKALGYNYGSYHGLNGVCYLGLFRKDDVKNPEPKPAPSFVPTPEMLQLQAESAAETLAWANPPQAFTNYPPPSSSSSAPEPAPQPVAEPAPQPADDAKSEASDAESDINDFIDFDVPIPYDLSRLLTLKATTKPDSQAPHYQDQVNRQEEVHGDYVIHRQLRARQGPRKENAKDLKLGAGIARSRVTSHYSERLTQHVKTIEKRVLCNELRKELGAQAAHERLVQYQINKARIAERKQKEAAELKARIEAQQQREAEAAAALAAQRERERQDLVQAAQAFPHSLKSAPRASLSWFPMTMTLTLRCCK